MEIEIIAQGRNMRYDAVGLYDGKGVTVLKGSKISSTVGKKVNPIVTKLRSQSDTVNSDFVLQRDVKFRSSSTAASFITGSIVNGNRVWKLKDGTPLGNLHEELE